MVSVSLLPASKRGGFGVSTRRIRSTFSSAPNTVRFEYLNEPLGLRDRAILETFYSTGMRRTELVELTLHSLDVERGTVLIRQGKKLHASLAPSRAERAAGLAVPVEEVLAELDAL